MPKLKFVLGSSITLTIFQLLFYIPFFSPALVQDDWVQFGYSFLFGGHPAFNPHSVRPMELLFKNIIISFTGFNIQSLFIISIILNIVVVLGLFFLLLYFKFEILFAFSVSLIYSLYPVDYTRLWLIMFDALPIWLMVFIFVALLYKNSITNQLIWVIFSIPVMIIVLLMYEGPWGLFFAIPLLMFFGIRKYIWQKRLRLLLPTGISLIFIIWRAFLAPNSGSIDVYAGKLQMQPSIYIERLIRGFGVMIWGWSRLIFRDLNIPYAKLFSFWIFPAAIIIGLSWVWVTKKNSDDLSDRKSKKISLLWMMGSGLILLCAGYFPVIGVLEPNTSNFGSRVNIYAIPGASIILTSFIYWLGFTFCRSRLKFNLFVIGALLPFIFTGTATRIETQHQARIAWNEQKSIWSAIFNIVPNVKEDTSFYLVFPQLQEESFLKRMPLEDSLEVESALKVLYNEPKIRGHILFLEGQNKPDYDRVILDDKQIKTSKSTFTESYSNALFIYYDPQTNKAHIVKT